MDKKSILSIILILLLFACKQNKIKKIDRPNNRDYHALYSNILNFSGIPETRIDRSMLMFSDQGAWFAYSLPDSLTTYGGFSGPFLMTQENGVWISPNLMQLKLSYGSKETTVMDWENNLIHQKSYTSHLEQKFKNKDLSIEQSLVYISGHTAMQRITITNDAEAALTLNASFSGKLYNSGIHVTKDNGMIKLKSSKSDAVGYAQLLNMPNDVFIQDSLSYKINYQTFVLPSKKAKEIIVSQTFIFPEYSWENEQQLISSINFDSVLNARKLEKNNELSKLIEKRKDNFKNDKYASVLAKAHLTLQNNWRIAAGKLQHQGLFPSYHYEWFHGFWSWDSWKHAVGLSWYNIPLAKDQIRAMFDYQNDDGFVVDCIYRDTTIEPFNYRDTKPPLAAWAVAEIFKKDSDVDFIKEIYPKLKKYHFWWYAKRDHDQDGLCEYGSTDGTVLAAKWESGMDNAIRFDDSNILKNGENAYSLNQESIDLNAYLYAEKLYLATLAEALGYKEDVAIYKTGAMILKKAIQHQFYDTSDGWFYDTNLEGTSFIKGAGSEGWIPLWANAATQEQAITVKNKMMDPEKFFTKVPFQTMAKDHPKFDPLNGYWRGPNWLDQAYFGVKGLRNYGFGAEADLATEQIIEGAEGLLDDGKAIRENYHPITGEGREARNFSWSAAHIIMLLTEDKNEL
ncbi:MGH1-like glycoside hydrolase domain-containing protein [Maribacter ulvicola]|uniref:Putative isomerase n=1 Tax=Maribacter ulvicola TaxID=228959 RepID=A0A1N6S517_9FLAO|nr:trehalase family glycosidase [Maribacter ulvicola]SIQ36062.1 putative isomerase [Maribacter ulvicola]